MTTVKASVTRHKDGSTITVQWESLGNGDTGAPVGFPEWADRTVQVVGTFGAGGTVVLEGSLDGGENYATLNDLQGNMLSFTTEMIMGVQEVATLIRPNVTAGDDTTNLTVIVLLRRAQPLRS